MNYKFNANHIVVEQDEFMEMICFADDEFAPSKFVILQKATVNNEDERAMGMDKIHIQVEDESRSNYGGIVAIGMIGGKVVFSFNQETKLALRIEADIEIDVDLDHPVLEVAVSRLRKMCESDGIDFSRTP